MMDFCTWFMSQLPGFLMTPPISGLVGLGILFVIARLFRRMINL